MPNVLTARRPLGRQEDEPLRTHGSFAVVRLDERPLEPMFELQFDVNDTAVAAALADATNFELTAINRAVTSGEATALWLGPSNWLIKAGPATVATLEHAVAMTRSSLLDVSDLWFGVSVAGPRSGDVLAKGCALDLHPLAPGATAVTQFVRMRALIRYVDAAPMYHMYVERSFATYLWAWLVDAMTEFLD